MTRKKNTEPIPEPKFDPEVIKNYMPPEEYRTHPNVATKSNIKKLIKLIDNNSTETEIDKFLTAHIELLTFIISRYSTGHHHSWIIPKKIIKTKISQNDKGLIPDFIIGGQSTSGKEWFIVELKGANIDWFIEKKTGGLYFTNTINKGINQLIEYLDYCDKYQAKFRDEHKLIDFTKPKAILIAGRRTEFISNIRKQSLKKTWQMLLGDKLEILTYDTLKYELKRRLNDFEKNKSNINRYNPFNK